MKGIYSHFDAGFNIPQQNGFGRILWYLPRGQSPFQACQRLTTRLAPSWSLEVELYIYIAPISRVSHNPSETPCIYKAIDPIIHHNPTWTLKWFRYRVPMYHPLAVAFNWHPERKVVLITMGSGPNLPRSYWFLKLSPGIEIGASPLLAYWERDHGSPPQPIGGPKKKHLKTWKVLSLQIWGK